MIFNGNKKLSTSLIAIILLMNLCVLDICFSMAETNVSSSSDPGILFVGEEIEMLSIASKREESAWEAPAIARVISRQDIDLRGYDTLSDALSEVPGFFMAQKEWGTQPYLRGIADSILFQYDAVPLGSEISKSFNYLDQNMSLASVKRIEIIHGPGSVLWGPDAFAGIVNIVPKSGKDLDGVETGYVNGASGKRNGAYLNLGADKGDFDSFLSVSARKWDSEDDRLSNITSFWGDGTRQHPVPPSLRYGVSDVKDSEYLDVSGNVSFKEAFILTAHFSKYYTPYTRSDQGLDEVWIESRNVDSGLVKLESNHRFNLDTAVRITGAYSWINPEIGIIDLDLSQKERAFYAEGSVDRSIFDKKGILTAGVAWKFKEIDDAPVWDVYYPDYLGSDELNYLPSVTPVDSFSRMWSFFSQYRHNFGNYNFWVGVRKDIHEIYGSPPSFNTGVSWVPTNDYVMKLIYGTANRTPSGVQLLENSNPDMEYIRNLSLQLTYKKERVFKSSLTGFYNKIDDHILEDPNVGASEPNNQKIWGMESDSSIYLPHENEIGFGVTWLQNSGPWEVYRYNDYSYIIDGEVIKHYIDLQYPYDRGSRLSGNIYWKWKMTDQLSSYVSLKYFEQDKVLYPLKNLTETYEDPVLLNLALKADDVFYRNTTFFVSMKNALDNSYTVPGVYGTIPGKPRETLIGVNWRW